MILWATSNGYCVYHSAIHMVTGILNQSGDVSGNRFHLVFNEKLVDVEVV